MGTHPIFESDFDCLTEMLRRAARAVSNVRTVAFIKGVSTKPSAPWCKMSSAAAGAEKKSTIYRVEDILSPPSEAAKAIEKVKEVAALEFLPKNSAITFETTIELDTEKGKITKKFNATQIATGIEFPNGGRNARIVVICDPGEVAKAFENGAQIAGSSQMMLDFIYEKPEVDFVFCMENQLDLFKGNQLFSNTAKKMGAALPVVKNEKKMIYNEFVIKDLEEIADYAKPLLKGNADHCQILLGDLTMDSDTLISNLEKVEEEINKIFKFVKSRKGKAAENDKIFFKEPRLSVAGMEPYFIEADNDSLKLKM